MSLVDSWGKMWLRPHRARQQKPARKLSTHKLGLEALEDRHLLSYAIADLGSLPSFPTSYGTAINASGQATGTANAGEGSNRAVLYSDGAITDLGRSDDLPSFGFGINDSGQVVGFSYGHAFLYSDGKTIDLGTLGGRQSGARGINNAGTVVGFSETADGHTLAFLYRDGLMTALDTLPEGLGGGATSINNRDQVTGSADTSGSVHAAFWDKGKVTDLGTLPDDDSSVGNALNDAGQVVGMSAPQRLHDGSSHAFLYDAGVMVNLGSIGGIVSIATGINGGSQVVGYSSLSGSHFVIHAFLYRDGTMTDLNSLVDPDSGWVLYQANGINDAGQIVGSGTNPDGNLHAFVLIPESEPLKQDQALFLHDSGLVRVGEATPIGELTSQPLANVLPKGAPLEPVAPLPTDAEARQATDAVFMNSHPIHNPAPGEGWEIQGPERGLALIALE